MGNTISFVNFEWAVPANGFRWQAGGPEEERAIEQKQVSPVTGRPLSYLRPEPGGYRVTRPLQEEPLLFRQFADLEETPEAFCDFANKHGIVFAPRGVLPSDLSHCETFPKWVDGVHAMRIAVELWTAIDLEEGEKLRDLIEIKDCKLHNLDERIARALLHGSPSASGYIKDRNKRGRIRRGPSGHLNIALEIIDALINNENQSTTIRLKRTPNRIDFDCILNPINLIGALWLQFGLMLSGGKRLVECPGCGATKFIGPHRRRGRVPVHCSNTCRQQAHRLRIKARQLRNDGRSINSIAKELAQKITTISDWLKQKGEK